ncbi:MAG: ABC transporter substrate-binding protein, partial [Treponema sp.]|nr:ABC transporter substrate-binding protein [Treponema sp.]
MKKTAVIALASAFVLTMAGCSKKTEKSSDAGGKMLNVMIEVEVESLDPQVATDGTSFEVIADFTDGLKQMKGDGSVTNALCSDETVSSDGLTYTFKIRDDAKWSNGEPVTADDFVFGWQRAADPKTASEYAYMLSDIGQIRNAAAVEAGKMSVDQLGVKAVDAKTFEVQLEVPVSYFDQILY